jgi:hypothetical protein
MMANTVVFDIEDTRACVSRRTLCLQVASPVL